MQQQHTAHGLYMAQKSRGGCSIHGQSCSRHAGPVTFKFYVAGVSNSNTYSTCVQDRKLPESAVVSRNQFTLRSASFASAVRNCSKDILRTPLVFTCSQQEI